MSKQKEPINYLIGRLKTAIRYKHDVSRQLELLEQISEWVIDFGVKHPDEVIYPDEKHD